MLYILRNPESEFLELLLGDPRSEPRTLRPRLEWRDPGANRDPFRLLDWQSRFTPLIGRDRERAALLHWARSGRGLGVHWLLGPAGVGKTRLAAEVAETLHREGWDAGFITLDQPQRLRIGEAGALLIIDRAWGVLPALQQLLSALTARPPTDRPIRFLLITREALSPETLEDDTAHPVLRLAALDPADAEAVYDAARDRMRARYNLGPQWPGAYRHWAAEDPAYNCRPLSALAAFVYAVYHAASWSGLSGPQLLRTVVQDQLNVYEDDRHAVGLPAGVVSRLAALAALRGGLEAAAIRRLADPSLEFGLPPVEEALRRVRRLPWWQPEGRFEAPKGDLTAAGLADEVLGNGDRRVASWLWAALCDAPASTYQRLELLMNDIELLRGQESTLLRQTLLDMVWGFPSRAHDLAFLLENEWPYGWRLLRTLNNYIALQIDPHSLDDEAERVALLRLQAANTVGLGGQADRLSRRAAWEAVEICRRLWFRAPWHYHGELAAAVHTWFRVLDSAFSAAERAERIEGMRAGVEIARELAAAHPEFYRETLAKALECLRYQLEVTDNMADAADLARQAVELRRRTAAQPQGQLAAALGALATSADALEARRESTELWRYLAAWRPWLYRSRLFFSLRDLARQAKDLDAATAIDAARECIHMARQDNPEPTISLARSLELLAEILGNSAEAAAALRQALQFYEHQIERRDLPPESIMARLRDRLQRRLDAIEAARSAADGDQCS